MNRGYPIAARPARTLPIAARPARTLPIAARPARTLFLLLCVAAAAACFPGAKAPNVTPQRTLEISSAEMGGSASSAPFAVVFAGPKGRTEDPSEVTIVWNRPMRPLELAGEESSPPARIAVAGGAVPKGTWRWLGTSALVFVPEKALPRATEYTVTIPAATKSLEGSTLGKDYEFKFETARPRVVHVTPGDGASHLDPKQTFELRLNQPVEPKEIERTLSIHAGKAKIPFAATRPKSDVPMLVKVTPKTRLPLDTKITLKIDAKLRGAEGPLPSEEEHVTNVETYGPLVVNEVQCSRTDRKLCLPHAGLHIELSNRVAWKDAKAHVRVEGATLTWPKAGHADDDKVDWIGLPVDLGPARQYRVVVTAGLKDEYGQVLARDVARTIVTDDENPSIAIGLRGGSVLEAAKAKGSEIPIASMNLAQYDLLSAPVDESKVMSLLSLTSDQAQFDVARGLPGARFERVVPAAPRNVTAQKNVPIDPLLSKGRGTFAVGISRNVGQHVYRSVDVVSVTDLAITARISRFGSIAYVSRLSDGKPVPKAVVTARSSSGADVAQATTDANGFVIFPHDKLAVVALDGSIEPGLTFFARSGDDWTWKMAQDLVERASSPYVDLAAHLGTYGMLFTDRGIYKPGETVRVKGVFRRPLPRGSETPKGLAVTVRANDPEGNAIVETNATLGAFGELALDVPIPKTSRFGHVQIEAFEPNASKERWVPAAAATSVEVAAYRPAEFKVTVEPDKTSYVRGDKATFSARGDYLFGAPMSGGHARYTVTRSQTSFAPEGTDGFVVDDEVYRWALSDASPRGGKIQGGNGALDGQGKIGASVLLALPNQVGAENVTIEAEIEDLSRQTIASQSTAIVHPADFYVALRRPKDLFVAAKTALRPEVFAVTPAGKRVAGVSVQIDLVERTWETVTEATGEWGMHYESRAVDKVVRQCTTTTGAEIATCALEAPDAGYYLVRARAKDGRGNPVASSYGVYASGEGARVAWPVYDGARLELVTDKASYEVGETATIMIKSPFKDAEAIVTIERQGIHKQEKTAFHGTMPTIKVPITDDMRPNTFVAVEIMKGRTAPAPRAAATQDVGAPSYKIGWAEISVNPEARRLRVDVRPSKKELRPGEEIDVDLAITDRAGKPARADVAFYAVDEGVLMLTGYKTPDPIPVMTRRRSLAVAPIETRDALARVVRFGRGPGEDKGDEGGGGGEEGAPAREDFRTTAFFQPSVVTGNDGKAKIRFKLPDSLTTYRLMAVATAEDDRFGFGEKQIVTSRPLMARPALPRFLRAGDAMEAGVIVTSKGLPAQNVEVKLETKGLVVTGETKKTVSLPANGSTEVRFRIGAPNAGPAELSFRAESAGGSDAVIVKRDVAIPMSLEAVALYGDTVAAVAERLGNLAAMRTDAGGLDLRVSSTALVGLDDGVEALVEYPYGCAEQLTSKMVPLVALGDLAKDYGVKLPKDPNAMADAAIAKILEAQKPDGGFGYWSSSRSSDPWLTAYVLWGLSLAKERGRPVPDASIENATRWLRGQMAACGLGDPPKTRTKSGRPLPQGSILCDQNDVALATQAFVVDVLAMIGKPDAGYTGRIFERRAKMPLFARALLAHAMAVSKMRMDDAKELVRDAENYLRVTGGGATLAENLGTRYAPILDSDNRTTAIVLRALVAVDPKHPLAARLAKGLLAARRGGAWRTTQENAWSLLALDAYRKAQEKDAPDFDAAIFFGEKEVFTAPFHERSVKAQGKSFAAAEVFGRSGENLAFQVRGNGRLFYEARLRYAKKELPNAPLERGFYVRKIVRSVKPDALSDALRTLPSQSASSANASDLVLVDLLVVTPDPREQVVIDDPLPAGLEPVQTNLATTARDLAVTDMGGAGDASDAEDSGDHDRRAAGGTFQRSWYHREFHDDRVLTFVDHMAAGMYHYRYLARATTSGTFVVPPTKAECMYEPETFGRTAASTFEVKK